MRHRPAGASCCVRSTDNGRTWSEPVPLNGSGTHYTWGRSKCLQLSDDDGVQWKPVGQVGPKYVYASHLVVLKDDTIVLTAGDSRGQCLFPSTDGGASWSPPIRVDRASMVMVSYSTWRTRRF